MKADPMQLTMRKMTALKGERVYLKAIGDRNRITVLEGTIDGVYPSLFTVAHETEEGICRKCFSYTDIITHRLFIKRIAEQ